MEDTLFNELPKEITPDMVDRSVPPTTVEALNRALATASTMDPETCSLFEFISQFGGEVEDLLMEKTKKYANEDWRFIPKLQWEQHVLQKIEQYAVTHEGARVPLPWVKMAAFCLIGWAKETYPMANRQRKNVELKREGGETAFDPRG